MKMSDGERLIAVMLAEIMEALKLNNEIDPSLVKSLVINNEGWALRRKYYGLFDSEPRSDDVVKETADILWMFQIIESSIERLTGAEADEAKGWHYKQWRGFDGNHDPHFSVAGTMIRDLGEFKGLRNAGDINSHSQSSLPHYREMYEKFSGYVRGGTGSLSFEALRDLCS